jgi:hypothetical protein
VRSLPDSQANLQTIVYSVAQKMRQSVDDLLHLNYNNGFGSSSTTMEDLVSSTVVQYATKVGRHKEMDLYSFIVTLKDNMLDDYQVYSNAVFQASVAVVHDMRKCTLDVMQQQMIVGLDHNETMPEVEKAALAKFGMLDSTYVYTKGLLLGMFCVPGITCFPYLAQQDRTSFFQIDDTKIIPFAFPFVCDLDGVMGNVWKKVENQDMEQNKQMLKTLDQNGYHELLMYIMDRARQNLFWKECVFGKREPAFFHVYVDPEITWEKWQTYVSDLRTAMLQRYGKQAGEEVGMHDFSTGSDNLKESMSDWLRTCNMADESCRQMGAYWKKWVLQKDGGKDSRKKAIF